MTSTTDRAAVTPAEDAATTQAPDAGEGPRGLQTWLLVVLIATICLSIGTPLLGMRTFAAVDILHIHAPWAYDAPSDFDRHNFLVTDTIEGALRSRTVIRDRVFEGDWPLWSSLPAGGNVLAAVPNVGMLSPLNVPYFVLPLWYAPAIVKLLEMVVAAGFTAAYLRRVRMSWAAALVGGLAFVNSGFLVVWTNWPQTQVGALIPGLFWALEFGWQRRALRAFLPLTVIAAAMLLSGFPAVTGYAFLAVGCYALARAGMTMRRERLSAAVRLLAAAGVAMILAGGLSALQLLPFTAGLGSYDLDYRQQAPGRHVPVESLITAVVPDAFGNSVDRVFYGLPRNYIEMQVFIGVVAVLLIAVAAVRGRHTAVPVGIRAAMWGLTIGTGWLLYVGGPPLVFLQRTTLLFGINSVGRMRSVFGLLLATLAGLGFEALIARSRRATPHPNGRSRLRAVAVWTAVALAATWAAVRLWHIAAEEGQLAYLQPKLVLPVVVAIVALPLLVTALRSRARVATVAAGALAALLAVQSVAFAHAFWPRPPVEQFFPRTPAHRFLDGRLGHDRFAGAEVAMYPATAPVYGLRSVTGHIFHDPEWAELLLAADPQAFHGAPTHSWLAPTHDVATSPVLDRMAARFFAVDPRAPLLGDLRPPERGTRTVFLAAGHQVETPLDAVDGALRGVTLQLQRPYRPPSPQPSYLHVEVLDTSGRSIATGSRRLRTEETSRRYLHVPLVEPDRVPQGPLRLRLEVSGVGRLAVGGDRDGRVVAAPVEGGDDGLRLVFVRGVVIYERLDALARIRWHGRADVEADGDRRLRRLQEGLDRDTVLLSSPGPSGAGQGAALEVREDSGDSVRVAVDAKGDGYLIVADAIDDKWRAWLDGQPVPLRAADHGLAAVAVPAGTHEVVLRYHPASFVWGRRISVGALAFILVIAVVPTMRTRWRRRGRPGA